MRQTDQHVVEVQQVGRSALVGDDALVARARRGDRDAFTLLIEPRVTSLLRTAGVILGNDADGAEATQEALVAAWTHLPSLRNSARFDVWLNRTLINKCRDALRRRGRVRFINLGQSDVETADTSERQLEMTQILAAFDRLPLEQRQILVMHHLDGQTVEVIASHLGIPRGTAGSRLWSARRALERALEAES